MTAITSLAPSLPTFLSSSLGDPLIPGMNASMMAHTLAPPSRAPDVDDTVPDPPQVDVSMLAAPLEAVKYLCAARVQLFNSLSPNNKTWRFWCGKCGALRLGLGGAAPSASSRKRTASGQVKRADSETDAHDEIEVEIQATLAAMEHASDGQSVPPSLPYPTRRKSSQCASCGASFSRPKARPPPCPSGRAVARTRLMTANEVAAAAKEKRDLATRLLASHDAAVSNLAPGAKAKYSSSPSSSARSSPAPSPQPLPLKGSSASVAKAGAGDESPLCNPDNSSPFPLSCTPSMTQVRNTSPAVQTYPKPALVRPPEPNGAGSPAKLPLAAQHTSPPPPFKKRKVQKKSGLAKLIAQNTARKEQQSSGNWGLD